jgi:hypothetical protein
MEIIIILSNNKYIKKIKIIIININNEVVLQNNF